MSASTEDDRLATAGRVASRGRITVFAAALTLLALLGVLFYDVFAGIVSTWARSETYAHGFLIPPLVLWLLWRRRDALHATTLRPDWRALALLALLGFVWLLGSLAAVVIAQQYAVVAMVPALIWLLGGRDLVRAWRFPLFFLLLAVPVGAFLVPPLMHFTADSAVNLLRLTGIPVYREGLYFSLPTGNWSVIAACSGIRYLIASFTLGCLYAYLSYRSPWRRLAFVAAAIIVPIAANAVRAYLIVLIGHLSSMRLAVGIDHLIYGWLFFGFVMLLLFWVGGFWREAPADPPRQHDAAGPAATPHGRVLVAALTGALVMAAWPVYAGLGNHPGLMLTGPPLALPAALPGWPAAEEPFTDWQPSYGGLSETAVRAYQGPSGPVGLYVGLYRDQREGAELVAWENGLVEPRAMDLRAWRVVSRAQDAVALADGATFSVPVAVLTNGRHWLAVWHWYWVSGDMTSSGTVAKLLTAKSRLLARSDAAAMVAVYVPLEAGDPLPRANISAFLQSALPVVTARLQATSTAEIGP